MRTLYVKHASMSLGKGVFRGREGKRCYYLAYILRRGPNIAFIVVKKKHPQSSQIRLSRSTKRILCTEKYQF